MPKYNPRTFGHSFAGTDVDIYVILQPISEFVGTQMNQEKAVAKQRKNVQDAQQAIQEIEESTEISQEDKDRYLKSLDEDKNKQYQEMDEILGNTGQVYRKLGEAATISYSVFRENKPVRGLGQTNIKGITKGPRTIAGSIIFVVFDRAVMKDLLDAITIGELGHPTLVDQLPPIDLFVVCSNEYGAVSRLVLSGVEFMNEGQVMSVHDLYTENTVNFQAREIETLEALDRNLFLTKGHNYITADSIISKSYKGIKETIDKAKKDMISDGKDKK